MPRNRVILWVLEKHLEMEGKMEKYFRTLLAIACVFVALTVGLSSIYIILRDAADENRGPDTDAIADST